MRPATKGIVRYRWLIRRTESAKIRRCGSWPRWGVRRMCANNSRSGAKLLNVSVPETVRESWCQGSTSREYWLYFSDAWPGSNSSHGVTKVDVRMEGRPRTGPRICYPGMLFLQLNFSSDSWVPVDNKNWNTYSKYVRCSNYLCITTFWLRKTPSRGVRVGILLRSRNVDARETSCDRKYVLAAWVRLSSVVFVCRRCITPLSCETGLY